MEGRRLKRSSPALAPRTSLGKSLGKKRTLGAKRKKRATNADTCREWLVPPQPLRFKGLRGIYWYWLSRDVRRKEWERWNHVCITCLEPIEDWKIADCGHMVASAGCGEFLRFNRLNLTIQHKKCNNPRFTPNAGARNAIHYDQRYGQGAWEALWEMRKIEAKEPKTEEYKELIRSLDSYQEALENMAQNKAHTLSTGQDGNA